MRERRLNRQPAREQPELPRQCQRDQHQCCAEIELPRTLFLGLEIGERALGALRQLRIASERARFGMPEVRVGIPSVIEAALLPGLIGWGRARRLLLTAETIDAPTAERWGLVDWCVPAAQLDAAVEELIAAICACGADAIRLQKALIRDWEDLPLSQAIERGIARFADAFDTDEPKRMMAKFLTKATTRKTKRKAPG